MQAQKIRNPGLAAARQTGFNRWMEAVKPASDNSQVAGSAAWSRDLLYAVGHKKDKEAFAALFEYFAPRIKSFLMKGGASPDAADELAQDTMVTIWQRAESFDPTKANASTWIFTIARNKRIDSLRRARPEFDPTDEDFEIEDDAPNANDMIAQQEEEDTMANAIRNLPEEQADLLYRSFFENKTHADIAKETSLPLGTVKSRIRIALDKLRGDKKVKELWS